MKNCFAPTNRVIVYAKDTAVCALFAKCLKNTTSKNRAIAFMPAECNKKIYPLVLVLVFLITGYLNISYDFNTFLTKRKLIGTTIRIR